MLQPDPNERFRQRRRQARRRRAARRVAALAVLALATGAVALGARFLEEGDGAASPAARSSDTGATTAPTLPTRPEPRPLPKEIRGVHVTMALMSIPGKFEEYLSLADEGATAIQIDVKDENGEVAFKSPHAPLATRIGSAQDYYKPKAVARAVHERDLHLIARVVVFEDPFLARARPGMAVQKAGGGVWTNYGGLGWGNQYDERVWKYNVDIAEGAARAGFDEIMFDYVRFPSDGPIESAVWPGRVQERKAETIARFLAYARDRLEPLGVRLSAAVFGLASTRDLGIGQRPRLLVPYLDSIYPMVYPSHYGSGEYGIDDPDGSPGATVTMSLRHFKRDLRGSETKLVPWLQDFSMKSTYTLTEIREQVSAARKVGASGYLLWNAAGVYTPGGVAP